MHTEVTRVRLSVCPSDCGTFVARHLAPECVRRITGSLTRPFESGRRESNSRSQLGNKHRAESGELQRTTADGLPSSREVAERGRTGANAGDCAIFVPWTEVRIELPDTVLRDFELQASRYGVSVELLLTTLLLTGQTVRAETEEEK